ncbi:MAG: RloB family protein [Campylobacterota bacterium]|nr:RloB family protein [Campylobacterota bacterium]
MVIDRDNHKCFFEIMKIARENSICVAFSNESYELWLLLHFQLVSVHTHRDNLKNRLNTIFLNRFQIEYEKSSQDVYLLLRSLQETAIKNAKILISEHFGNFKSKEDRSRAVMKALDDGYGQAEVARYLNITASAIAKVRRKFE